jgi:hypothetical protein
LGGKILINMKKYEYETKQDIPYVPEMVAPPLPEPVPCPPPPPCPHIHRGPLSYLTPEPMSNRIAPGYDMKPQYNVFVPPPPPPEIPDISGDF